MIIKARNIASFGRANAFMRKLWCVLAFTLISFSFINGQVISNSGTNINVVENGVINAAQFYNHANGSVTNNGTINLTLDYSNRGLTQGNGLYKLMRNWSNRGTFISGTSEVRFVGNYSQTILSGGDPFFKLSISNIQAAKNVVVSLEDDVVVTDTLVLLNGNVDTKSFLLYLSSLRNNSLKYLSTSSSRIIGNFKRGVGEEGSYLFPLGNDRYYNPITLTTNETPDAGTVLGQFFTTDPGTNGLPIADPPVEVWNIDKHAYWRLTPGDYFISENYDVSVGTNGFTDTLFTSSRLIRRERGGLWTVDGTHVDADTINKIVKRANLETSLVPTRGTEFAIGRVRPRILEQPVDTAVCEGQNAFFKTSATGTRSLRYQWYKLVGGIGQQISRTDPHYSGVRTDSLTILNTTLDDIGYYFCLIRDRNNQTISTDTVSLHVGRVPIVTVTTADQPNECSNIPIDDIIMHLSNYDEGTRFVWTRSTDSNIITDISETGTESDISAAIRGSFVNTSDNPITITFEIIPIGPTPTSCTGESVYSNVTINPTPRLILADTTTQVCYGTETAIELVSPTQMTMGTVVFDYSVTSENSTYLSGNMNPAYNQTNNTIIQRAYTNSSDTLYSVFFHIIPKNNDLTCYNGVEVTSEVKIHPLPLQNVFESTAITCEENDSAEITIVLSKSSKPSTISWISPWIDIPDRTTYDNIAIQNATIAGTYTVTVTDSMSCSNSQSVVISEAPNFSTVFMAYKYGNGYNTTCYNSNDGIIRIGEGTASAVVPPFTYQITNLETNTVVYSDTILGIGSSYYQDISYFTPGWYQLTMKDANGCMNILTTEVTAPDPVSVSFDTSDFLGYNISCDNYSDGSVWIKGISGGSGNYSYRWFTNDGSINGSNTTDRLDNVPAGTYYLEITDLMGCVSIDSITLSQPEGMNLTNYSLSLSEDQNYNISCFGSNDGAIEISVTNGSGNLSYSWTKVNDPSFTANTKDISSLTAGTYVVSVIDGNNCELRMPVTSSLPEFTLTEPEPFRITSVVTSSSLDGNYNITCPGGTGSIDFDVIGGSTISNYVWETSDGSGIVEGEKEQHALTAGTYHIIVNDINGCYADTTITLTEPDPIVTYFDITHISCHELGSISLSVEGGTPPYSNILWSTGATTDYIDNLNIGTYTVSLVDANGCYHIDSARVEYPPSVEYTLISSDYNGLNTSCYGVADGWINITPLSGKAPYLISLSNDDSGEVFTTSVATTNSSANISNIKAGTYTLTLTDDNQCATIETITITGPGLFELNAEPSVANNPNYNIPCYGEATGSIQITAVNAVGNVEYLWSDGATTRDRSGLTAGSYSVVAVDRNNCQAQTAVTLVQPQQLAAAFTITNAWCPDKPDGSIETDIMGGAAPYSFEWSNGSTELSLTNLVPDIYVFTAIDDNGCQINREVVIEYEHRTCLDLPNAISPNGDLINDEWHITYNNLYPNMVVKILNRWGNVIWQSEKGYPIPWDGRDSRGTELPMDSYHYIIDFGDGRKPQVGSITIVRDK